MAKILSPLQNNFLVEFFHLTQDFYLTGGTALSAYYLQHRYSDDIDLFTLENIAFQMADKFTKQVCSKLNISGMPVRITSVFKHFQIGSKDNPLTVHFALESAPQIKPIKSFEGILVDSIPDYFEPAQQKDAGLTWESLAYTLSQFEFSDIPDFMLKPLTVAEIKKFIETTIEWLIKKSAPPAKY